MKVIYKFFFLLFILFLCNNILFSQKRNGFRLISGDCKVVIDDLRKSQANDSIAVEVFKDEYVIDKLQEPDKLLQKKYTEIIKYFDSKEGRKYKCHLKDTEIVDPVLLIN